MILLNTYRRRRRLSEECGQSMVEVALMLPFLITLFIGIADFGWLAYCYIEVANAANAGAHYAAQTVIDSADLNGIQAAVSADAGNLTGVTSTVSLACTCSDGATTVTCTSFSACVVPHRVVDNVTVNTQVTVKPLFRFPGLGSTVTLKGSATMRVEEW